MRRIEIYIDSNKRLVLCEFVSINSQNESLMLRDEEAYQYIKKLASYEIKEIYESTDKSDLTLETSECLINLNEFDILKNHRLLNPLLNSIIKYSENINLRNAKNRKVTRENKYTGTRIIAGALTVSLILGMAGVTISEIIKRIKGENIDIDTSTTAVEEEYESTTKTVDEEITTILSDSGIQATPIGIDHLSTETEEETKIDDNYIKIEYQDRSNTEKAIKTRELYTEEIEKYSKIYGLDSKIIIAIATQESGIHSTRSINGCATGLMQIENSVWRDQKLTVFNYDTLEYETIVVNVENLSDLNYNIKVACMIFQDTLRQMNDNYLLAIQCYNMGYGNIMRILSCYANDSGKAVMDILNNPSDIGWMDYRDVCKDGDQFYVEHVLSYVGQEFESKTKTYNQKEVSLNIKQPEKVLY